MPYPTPEVSLFDELGIEEGTSPRFSLVSGQPQITRTWRTLEIESDAALTLLAGDVKLPSVLNGKLERWNPHKCPRYRPVDWQFENHLPPNPDNTGFYCTGIPSITNQKWMAEENDGGPDPPVDVARTNISNVWKHHHIEAVYERPVYEVKPEAEITWEFERYVSEGESQLSADIVSLPGGTIFYYKQPPLGNGPDPVDGRPIPFNFGKVFPTTILNFTWHRIPSDWYKPGTPLYRRIYGTSTSDSFVGTVNKKELFGRPPGTLLFNGVTPERRISPLGRIEWNLTFSFGFDAHHWLKKWFFDTGGSSATGYYLAMVRGATYPAGPNIYDNIADNTCLYNVRDHRELFWVADEAIVPPPP